MDEIISEKKLRFVGSSGSSKTTDEREKKFKNTISFILTRDLPRFFDQVGHQTTNASIKNKHFFH